jgi:chemotaxis response regulator CheB
MVSPQVQRGGDSAVVTRVAPLPVVGIGASAGGLDALERFFEHVPLDSGMAFVVVQHLSPDFRSLMDEILARRTKLPIRLVENGMPVEANHVYLIRAASRRPTGSSRTARGTASRGSSSPACRCATRRGGPWASSASTAT